MGACFVSPKKVLEDINYLDEKIIAYLDDTDLCRRIWESGKSVYYLGEISAIHLHQKASGDGKNVVFSLLSNKYSRMHLKSWIYYILKYFKKDLPKGCPSSKK